MFENREEKKLLSILLYIYKVKWIFCIIFAN